MPHEELTLEVLKDIRQELRTTRTELKSELGELRTELKAEIAETNRRLDALSGRFDVLSSRVVQSEIRVATAVTDLHGTVRDLVDLLRLTPSRGAPRSS